MKTLCASIFLLFMGFPFFSHAQREIRGKVIDSSSRKALPFVHVLTEKGKGVSTDIDGTFKLQVPSNMDFLRFSYVGYENRKIPLPPEDTLLVRMKEQKVDLREVEVLPGKNPAHRIIRKVIENRAQNDPEKLDRFSYRSYNKFLYTQADSLEGTRLMESIPDSSQEKRKEFFRKHHLMLMESVTQRTKSGKEKDKEVVLGNRVSGLKDPKFAALATNIQEFSFYDTRIEFLGKDYRNPISPGAISKYLYLLEDTLYDGSDSVFVISFRPRSGKSFTSLKGILSIHTDGSAIQNVRAEPVHQELNKMKIEQQYRRLDNGQWFPEQHNVEVLFVHYGMVLKGTGYIREVQTGKEVTEDVKENVRLKIDDNAATRDSIFWQENRTIDLTPKDQRTYQVVDSIGEAENLDRTMNVVGELLKARYPIGWIDLRLNKFFDQNEYEGTRLGVGLMTNDEMSRRIHVGGYWGYGIRDQAMKYGGTFRWDWFPDEDKGMAFHYRKDLFDPGRVDFPGVKWFTDSEYYRHLASSRRYEQETWELSFSGRVFDHLTAEAYGIKAFRNAVPSFLGLPVSMGVDVGNVIDMSKVGVKLRWAYGEDFLEGFGERIPMSSGHPTLKMDVSKSLDVWNGETDNWEGHLIFTDEFALRGIGKTRVNVQAGMLLGTVPLSEMKYGRAGNFGRVSFYTRGAFPTMRFYEFMVDRYAYLFLEQELGTLYLDADWTRPKFVIVQNIGYGSIDDNVRLTPYFNTMEKGFYESGLLIRNLLRQTLLDLEYIGLGIGAYYRYGPYAYQNTLDNTAFVFTFDFSL